MRLIIIGPQGSGKGTQAALLSKHFKIAHIDAGLLLRKESQKNTKSSKNLRKIIDKGMLISDKIMINILSARLKKSDCKKGFIIDGFPRTKFEAEFIGQNFKINKVLFLNISDSLAVKRLSARMQCEKCGAIYGVSVLPKINGFCNKCKGRLFARADDTPAIIKKRLKIYHAQINPIIKFYTKKNLIESFNGEKPAKVVFKKIILKLAK